jgi:hypothetical protein
MLIGQSITLFVGQFITWSPAPLVAAVRHLVAQNAVALARDLALVHHQIEIDVGKFANVLESNLADQNSLGAPLNALWLDTQIGTLENCRVATCRLPERHPLPRSLPGSCGTTNRRLTVIRCPRFDSRRIMILPTRSHLQGRAIEE